MPSFCPTVCSVPSLLVKSKVCQLSRQVVITPDRKQDFPVLTGWAREQPIYLFSSIVSIFHTPTSIYFSRTYIYLSPNIPAAWSTRSCQVLPGVLLLALSVPESCNCNFYSIWFIILIHGHHLRKFSRHILHKAICADSCMLFSCVFLYLLLFSVLVRTLPDSQSPEAFTSPLPSHRLSNGHRNGTSNGGGLLTPCNSATSSRAARSATPLLVWWAFPLKREMKSGFLMCF